MTPRAICRAADRIGQRLGYLVVERVGPSTRDGRARVYCRCERCGSTERVLVRVEDIVAGRTITCGCARSDRARQINDRRRADRRARAREGEAVRRG